MKAEKIIKDYLSQAGISIEGDNPGDISVHNGKFYERVLQNGSLGLGESYMDGWWDAKNLDETFYKALRSNIDGKIINWRNFISITPNLISAILLDSGSKSRAHNIDAKHYGIGNDLYKAMLDPYMSYTCGYWKDAEKLNQAQIDKFDLICRKLGFTQGMKVLDLGCGWGGFLKYASEKYRIQGVGVTISKNQATLGKEMCKNLPIEIQQMDYRNTEAVFDRVVSIGLLEHVGTKYHRIFFEHVRKSVKEDGLVLIHTIGGHKSKRVVEPWTNKYIFPGGVVPSFEQVASASQDLFVMEDWHNFGYDYYRTLISWFNNFNNAWSELKKSDKYDERFYRMWKYYLLSTAGAFKARRLQLWQIVLSPKGVDRGYSSVR